MKLGMKTEIVKLTLPVSSSRDHIQSPTSAPVTLIEYGDYECPYCGQAYQIIKDVQKHLENKLRFAFRNFPLTEVHPHAQHVLKPLKVQGNQLERERIFDPILVNDRRDLALHERAHLS